MRKPRFENKENFWINCVCIKAFATWHTLKETFAFIAYPSGYLHHCIPTRGHSHHKRTSHNGMHQGNIYIMTYPQGDIHIMIESIRIMKYSLEGIYTTRFCASPSLQKDICIVVWIRALISSWINFAFSSLHGTSASWKLHLYRCQKAFASETKNLDLHHILFVSILTSRLVV